MPSKKIFGTDGIRDRANSGNMTASMITKIGMAAGLCSKNGKHRHMVLIGKDTRLSGYLVEPALTAGFISVGMDVVLVGPIPTPAISMLTRSLRADLGVMISASHNPYHDNGVKFFGPDGEKLSDEMELKIEEKIGNFDESMLVDAESLGRARRMNDAPGRYIEYVKHSFPKNLRLDGIKIVLDCANGAAYNLGKSIFWELGADVILIGAMPDGININNDCGSNSPDNLRNAVLHHNADIGIALDGDADRVLVIDEKGNIIDGDKIIAAIATYWSRKGLLKNNTVVTTVMSNMSMDAYLRSIGVRMVRTVVGDKYVSRKMKELGCNLGGEQSGHIIVGSHASTGDGLMAALQLLAAKLEENKPVSELCGLYEPYLQLSKNIRYDVTRNDINELMKKTQIRVTGKLSKNERLVLRKSGTEPLIRVMVEGQDETRLKSLIAEVII